jgi:hypothetical protein
MAALKKTCGKLIEINLKILCIVIKIVSLHHVKQKENY